MDLTADWVGVAAIVLFVAAYSLVITEEFTHLRWTPAIALGYALSIWLHMVLNRSLEGLLPYAVR